MQPEVPRQSLPTGDDLVLSVGGVRCPSARLVSSMDEAVERVYSKELSLAVFPLTVHQGRGAPSCSWSSFSTSSSYKAHKYDWDDCLAAHLTIGSGLAEGLRRHGIERRDEQRDLEIRIKDFAQAANAAADKLRPDVACAHVIFATGAGPTPHLHVDGPGYQSSKITYLVIGTTLVSDLLADANGASPEVTGRGMVFVPEELTPRLAITTRIAEQLRYEQRLTSAERNSSRLRHSCSSIVDTEVKAAHSGRSAGQYIAEVPLGFGCCFRGGEEDGLVHGSPVVSQFARSPSLTDEMFRNPPPEAGLLRRISATVDILITPPRTPIFGGWF